MTDRIAAAEAVRRLTSLGAEVDASDHFIYADYTCNHCQSRLSYGNLEVDDGTV